MNQMTEDNQESSVGWWEEEFRERFGRFYMDEAAGVVDKEGVQIVGSDDIEAFISKVAQKSREDALRWISYEEAPFPNHGREVLTKNMLQGGVMKLVRWDKIHKRFVSKGEHVYESQLGTHWMEIPELPPKQ